MTSEQLDAIEKLAEAATLGEWPEDEHWDGEDGFCAQGPYHTCPHGGHSTTRGTNDCNETLSNAALADQQFLQKVAEYALPLVKALREARAEVERLREAAMQIRLELIDMRLVDGLDAIDKKRRKLFEVTKGMVE